MSGLFWYVATTENDQSPKQCRQATGRPRTRVWNIRISDLVAANGRAKAWGSVDIIWQGRKGLKRPKGRKGAHRSGHSGESRSNHDWGLFSGADRRFCP